MEISQTTFRSSFINELTKKCHRYRYHLIFGMIGILILSILNCFLTSSGSSSAQFVDSVSRISIGGSAYYLLPMLLSAIITVLINLPHETNYQYFCNRNKRVVSLVNNVVVGFLALYSIVTVAFSPYIISAIAIGAAKTHNYVYDMLLHTPLEIFYDFLMMGGIFWLTYSLVYKFMVTVPKGIKRSLLLVGIAISAVGIAAVIVLILVRSQVDIGSNSYQKYNIMVPYFMAIALESIYAVTNVILKKAGKKI